MKSPSGRRLFALTAVAMVVAVLVLAGCVLFPAQQPQAPNGPQRASTGFDALDTSGYVKAGSYVKAGTYNETGSFLILDKKTGVTVTAGMAIVPTGSYQPITAAAPITNATLSTASITTGTLLRLVNTGTNTITVTEASTAKTPGTSLALGQYDSAMFMFDGTYWIAMGASDN